MDMLLQAMSLALADVAADLSARYPDLYAAAGRELMRPDRVEPDYGKVALDERCQRWCKWCGGPFGVDRPSHPTVCCTKSCGALYAAFKKRRAA